ncbi:MAG TPA: LPS assembly lipoprotein LptE [Bacteroidota bacterium]|nr:LPS assembly lipoprotein LptE [Candidatus Kapabacteria bacterium]HRS01957.1 LPS assembly lipoprotein LptE [Bacteroidota bacterium]HRT67982.1 LPS assembly lipoprotein LptE [Bacteroidota bacterium]
MKKIIKIKKYILSSLIITVILSGCYSFKGSSVPDYLKTISIPTVVDATTFGVPEFKDYMTDELISQFQKDGTFKISQNQGDAILIVQISDIREEIQTLTQAELEKQRKITVTCQVEYYDNVNKKLIWQKSFSNYNFYDLADGMVARNETIKNILKNNANDILLSVISGW